MMISRRAVIASLAAAATAPSVAALGQGNQNKTQAPTLLSDDHPRAELFKLFIEEPGEVEIRASGQPFVLARSFVFPDDARTDDKGKERKNQLFGVDISHHNGKNISFDALKEQKVHFCYIKAGQGKGKE